MAMFIDNLNGVLRFDVPNSEANIDAQHFGMKDRSVGSYYMSERYTDCKKFLCDFVGKYYFDIQLCIDNCREIINLLESRNYNNAFKKGLLPQKKQIEALEWLKEENGNFVEIPSPSVNDNEKYLKLDNENNYIQGIKTLLLGDICSLFFKKIGTDGFIIYIDKAPNFEKIFDNNTILKWMK